MTGLVRKATLFGVCAVLAASTAVANVPDATNSTITDATTNGTHNLLAATYIDVVTGNAGAITSIPALGASGGSLMTLTLRDFAGNAVAGANVVIDFTDACDINLSLQQVNGVTSAVAAGTQTVVGTSNASGVFAFRVAGAAKGGASSANYQPLGSGTTSTAEVKIMVNNNLVSNAFPVAWDQNVSAAGAPTGVTAADLGFIITSANAAASVNVRRSDYNHSGNVGAASDIGFALSRFGANANAVISTKGVACPVGN